jgi:hypothetical protein
LINELNRSNWASFTELDACNICHWCHKKQFLNYFEKDCFNLRAGSERDKWDGFVREHFYNDIIRAKRISIAILFVPRSGKTTQ